MVIRHIDERDLVRGAKGRELHYFGRVAIDLRYIAPLEFRSFLRVVPITFPQFRAGCDVFDPVIQRGGITENTARPKTFDKSPRAVGSTRFSNARLSRISSICVNIRISRASVERSETEGQGDG